MTLDLVSIIDLPSQFASPFLHASGDPAGHRVRLSVAADCRDAGALARGCGLGASELRRAARGALEAAGLRVAGSRAGDPPVIAVEIRLSLRVARGFDAVGRPVDVVTLGMMALDPADALAGVSLPFSYSLASVSIVAPSASAWTRVRPALDDAISRWVEGTFAVA